MKKVSVIVPVYNTQEYLKECAESLVKQTLEDIEIIFINDGSTDDSLAILKEYQRNYPNKIVVKTKENGGQAVARNFGISIATGEYIGFVDSDDSVDTRMFEKLYVTAKQTGSDFVECDYKYLQIDINGKIKELPPYGNVRDYGSKKNMFIDPLVSPWNKIYKADVLKNNNIIFPKGMIYEDTAFFIKSIPYIAQTSYVPEKFVFHYLRANSTMNANRDKKVGDIFDVLLDIVGFYKESAYGDIYKKELEYFCVKILLCSSLKRIALVQDAKLRKEFIRRTIEMIKNHFSSYRKNDYFKRNHVGLYMRCMNSLSIPVVVALLRIKRMWK